MTPPNGTKYRAIVDTHRHPVGPKLRARWRPAPVHLPGQRADSVRKLATPLPSRRPPGPRRCRHGATEGQVLPSRRVVAWSGVHTSVARFADATLVWTDPSEKQGGLSMLAIHLTARR